MKELKAVWLTLGTIVRYMRGQLTDDEMYERMDRARALAGRRPLGRQTYCRLHGWQPQIVSPGLANTPTCVQCV